jgi:photosystem II stability/assembly factor-like uncharacterized protein
MNNYILSLAVKDSIILAGNTIGLFLSTNYGANWIQKSVYGRITSIIATDTNIYASAYGSGFNRSTNNGENWTALNNGLTTTLIHKIFILETNIFLGTEYGIFISSDNGTHWAVSNEGITNELVISLTQSGSHIFAGTESNGLFLSTDEGENWIPGGLDQKSIFALATSHNNIFAGACLSGGMYITTNYGENWTAINNGLTDFVILSLVTKGNNIFAGTSTGVFLSTNNGGNWATVNNGITSNYFYAMAAGKKYVFAGSNNVPGGIFRSSNNGQSWSLIDSGLTNPFIRSILVDGTNIYAGTYDGVFFSSNNGDIWSSIGLKNLTVYSLIKYCSYIIAGTKEGVSIYNKCSDNWLNINQGFVLTPWVYSLLLTNNHLLAGTVFQSLWRHSLWNIIGINNILENSPATFSLKQNYPNPFNPSTKIHYDLPTKSFVKLEVFDALGREIESLVNGFQNAGTYETIFNASQYPSGVYFYRLTTDNFSETKKMLFIK